MNNSTQQSFVDKLRARFAEKGIQLDIVQQMGVVSAFREVGDFEGAPGFVVSHPKLTAIVEHLELCAACLTDMRAGYEMVRDLVKEQLAILPV